MATTRPFNFTYSHEGPLSVACWLYPMEATVEWEVEAHYPSGEPGEVELQRKYGMRIRDEFAARSLVWALTAGFTRAAMPHYHRDEALRLVGRPLDDGERVRWEYDFETFEWDGQKRDLGFVGARSDTALGGRTAADLELGEAVVLEPSEPAEFHRMSAAGDGDSDKAISLFGLKASPRCDAEFLQLLRGSARPRIEQVIAKDEIFAFIGQGHDLGGVHVVLIKSHADLRHRVEAESKRVLDAMNSYALATGEFTKVEEWDVALLELQHELDAG